MPDNYKNMSIIIDDSNLSELNYRYADAVEITYRRIIQNEEYRAKLDNIELSVVGSLANKVPIGYRVIGIANIKNDRKVSMSVTGIGTVPNITTNAYIFEDLIDWDTVVNHGEIPEKILCRLYVANVSTSDTCYIEKKITYVIAPIEVIPDKYRVGNDVIELNLYNGKDQQRMLKMINFVYCYKGKASTGKNEYIYDYNSAYSDTVPDGYTIVGVSGLNKTNNMYTKDSEQNKEDENSNTLIKVDYTFTRNDTQSNNYPGHNLFFEEPFDGVPFTLVESKDATEHYRYKERTLTYVAVPTECILSSELTY